jgi:hypothetical protein
MGTLGYDASLRATFSDRTLAHLQLVIGQKLRRGEPFYFSWHDDEGRGIGWHTVWVHPAVSLVFAYSDGPPPAVDRAWLEELADSANSVGGLRIVPDPSR